MDSLRPAGHDRVLELLRRLHSHSLLFVGPERVGRRKTARWYGAYLNCQGKDKPCGICESCQLFLRDSHPDYREIRADASTQSGRVNRRPELRISQLVYRQGQDEDPLGPWLETRPRFSRRVGVIDGADQLTTAAVNAFLKFLEEPPSYAQIILIAPSPQAVLATVTSRSTPISFRTVPQASQTHPLTRLGRYGDGIIFAEHPELAAHLQETIQGYLQSLPKGLEAALEAADALEKCWLEPAPVSLPDLLLAALGHWPSKLYAEAAEALARTEEALASYASPGIAIQVLTLELRALLAATGFRPS